MSREELFDKYLQRQLSGEDTAELQALLKNDPAAGRQFVGYVSETSLFIRIGTQLRPETPVPSLAEPDGQQDRAERELDASVSRVRWWPWAALAATLAALAVAGWRLAPPSSLAASVATFEGDWQWIRQGTARPWQPGATLRDGDLLATGPRAKITVLLAESGARVELQSGSRVRLAAGDTAVRVGLIDGVVRTTVPASVAMHSVTLRAGDADVALMHGECQLQHTTNAPVLRVFDGEAVFAWRGQTPGLPAFAVPRGFVASASPAAGLVVQPDGEPPWFAASIGSVARPGSANFTGTNLILAGAAVSPGAKESVYFAGQSLPEDADLIARLPLVTADNPAAAGLMVRQDLDAKSAHVFLAVLPGGELELSYSNGRTHSAQKIANPSAARWLKLARQGEVMSASFSTDGKNWMEAGHRQLYLSNVVHFGFALRESGTDGGSTVVFDEIRMMSPSFSDGRRDPEK